MTASGVPSEGKGGTPSKRRGWLDPAIWLGILSVLVALRAWPSTKLLVERALSFRKDFSLPRSSDYYNFVLMLGVLPFVFLGALIALFGIAWARTRRSTWGLRLSVAGLALAVMLLLISFAAEPSLWWSVPAAVARPTMTARAHAEQTAAPQLTATAAVRATQTAVIRPTQTVAAATRRATQLNRSEAALAAGPVFVPAGEFLMGSAEGTNDADADETPQRRVYLDAYWIDRVEVTNALYARCVAAGACSIPTRPGTGIPSSYYSNPDYENHPVVNVSWADVQAYCQWTGGRLPTEAEWEKAARGTDGRTFPWGDETSGEARGNFGQLGTAGTTPVGAYPAGASPYGALDMAGNVVEWVADWYGENYYANASAQNPMGPPSGQYRVARGGTWSNDPPMVRAANRGKLEPTYRNDFVGFRCARSE